MPLTSLIIPRRSLTFYSIKDATKTRGIFLLKTVSIHHLFPSSSSAWAWHVFFCVQHVKPESGLWAHMIYWEVLFTTQQWRQQDKPWQGPRQGCNFTWGLTSPISVSSEAWVATWIKPKSGAKRSAFCTLLLVSHWLQAASGRRQTSPVFQWLAAWLGEFDRDSATVSNWHWEQLGLGASGCVGHQPHPPVWGGSRSLASVSNLLDYLCSFVVFHRQAFWLLSPQAMPSCLGLWERLSILPIHPSSSLLPFFSIFLQGQDSHLCQPLPSPCPPPSHYSLTNCSLVFVSTVVPKLLMSKLPIFSLLLLPIDTFLFFFYFDCQEHLE